MSSGCEGSSLGACGVAVASKASSTMCSAAERGRVLLCFRVGQQNRGTGILEHVGEAFGREGRIQRQVRASGREDAQNRDDHLWANA